MLTLTNPTFGTYVLHILQGHSTGFHVRIWFVNLDSESFFISVGIIDQILGPRWAKVSVPQYTVLILNVLKIFSHGYFPWGLQGKTSLIISGARPYATL